MITDAGVLSNLTGLTGLSLYGNAISNLAFVNALQNYVNVPQALLQRAEDVEAETMPEASEQAESKPDPRKVQNLRNYLRVYAPSKP